MSTPIPPRGPLQEQMLLDQIERLDRLREGRMAVHVHLSKLSTAYQRAEFLRIATDTFESIIRSFEGQFFALQNSDLVFIAKDATTASLGLAVDRIKALFTHDPLTQFQTERGPAGFSTWYNLETDYPQLLEVAKAMLKEAEDQRKLAPVLHASVNPEDLTAPIRPDQLAKLETALERADISHVVRRQTACSMIEGRDLQVLFEEIYVSIEDLQSIATPGIDLLANRWLFQYLTLALDKRMLALIGRGTIPAPRPFSLNLNIATILSQDFSRFANNLPQPMRGKLVIELDKLDVFADMGGFLFARDFLREHGFRLCLDGLTHHTMPYYDRTKLGFDLVKIHWTPGGLDEMMPAMVPAIRSLIMEIGQARTILSRCDNERAVTVGQDLGIVMFQGRYVDGVIGLKNRTPTTPAR